MKFFCFEGTVIHPAPLPALRPVSDWPAGVSGRWDKEFVSEVRFGVIEAGCQSARKPPRFRIEPRE